MYKQINTYKQIYIFIGTGFCNAASHSKIHYENTPIQIYRKFHLQKLKKFR